MILEAEKTYFVVTGKGHDEITVKRIEACANGDISYVCDVKEGGIYPRPDKRYHLWDIDRYEKKGGIYGTRGAAFLVLLKDALEEVKAAESNLTRARSDVEYWQKKLGEETCEKVPRDG